MLSRLLHDPVWWRDVSSRAIGTAIGTGTGAAGAVALAVVSGIDESPGIDWGVAAIVVVAILATLAVHHGTRSAHGDGSVGR